MAEPMKKSGYISDALAGSKGPSDGMVSKGIGRGQSIKSAYPMDNVELAMEVPDERGGKLGGSTTNLSHSLKGASAVDD